MSGLAMNVTVKIKEAYSNSEDFRRFVDAYASSRKKSIDNALRDNITLQVYKLYICVNCRHNVDHKCVLNECKYDFEV